MNSRPFLAFLLTLVLGGRAPAQSAPAPATLRFSRPETQALLGPVYQAALENLLRINTVSYTAHGGARVYNQTGLLSSSPHTFFRAGGGYRQPWTRDASVNSWSGGSLLAPLVARNTLWSVVRRTQDGQLIVQQDDQWWDQVIWITAAWNHFLVTGDQRFLRDAYQTAANTLTRDRELHYNPTYGLYRGAAFLNDGIAGYPVPPADTGETQGSFVLNYPGAAENMALSTNCLYVAALRAAAQMATVLHRPATETARWDGEAETLAATVRKAFWLPEEGRFGYLLSPGGLLDPSQEGAGTAFALLFGIAAPDQVTSALRTTHLQPYGLPDVWPSFARYSATHPGRHNVILWPPLEAFWAEANARAGNVDAFAQATATLAGLVAKDRDKFWEIYNSDTGFPDGGWQVNHAWYSEPDQTWSATGYLRMIYAGLFGLRFEVAGLRFAPVLPATWGDVSLAGLHYRGMVLNITLHGAGTVVRRFELDGVPQAQPLLPGTLHGTHAVTVELGTAIP